MLRDRPHSQQVAWLHGEPAGQMQYQTGPPGVGQVVGVCAPPFSQQLLRVADDLQLDLRLVALGAHPRQLRTYPVAFPPHALKGYATVIAVPVLAGLRRSALVRVVAHRTLLVVVRKHLVLPVSHDIGTAPSSSPTCRLVLEPEAYSTTALRRVPASTGARLIRRWPGSSSSTQRANSALHG